MNNTTTLPEPQPLVDIHPKTKKLIQWNQKKLQTNQMGLSHIRIGKKDQFFKDKSWSLNECGRYLEFKSFIKSGEKKLNRANFCKYRLCPMCSWRRSLKIFGQASQVMDEAKKQGYRFLFITLTVKNVIGEQLQHDLDNLYKSLVRLNKLKEIRRVVKGSMRVIEITHNIDRLSKSFDTYHHHVHIIWAVDSSYFKSRNYISQAKLTELWKKVGRLDYKPLVHIEAVNEAKKGHIREVSKYSVKPSDILTEDNDLTDSTVKILDQALYNRRLLSWTGILKKIRSDFNFDDPENGDLVNVDGQETINAELDYILVKYYWHAGYKQYLKSDK